MALNDAEYIFNQTSRERKRNGIGTFSKKRQGGHIVRFPSDGLSRKEKKELNGEVKTYSFYKPLKWDEFSKMPDDIKQEYLNLLESKFDGLPLTAVAESLGVTMNTMSPHMFNHGLKYRVGKKMVREKTFLKTDDGKAWVKWHEDSAEDSEELDTEEESDIDKIVNLIRGLAGTGAKITIEMTL